MTEFPCPEEKLAMAYGRGFQAGAKSCGCDQLKKYQRQVLWHYRYEPMLTWCEENQEEIAWQHEGWFDPETREFYDLTKMPLNGKHEPLWTMEPVERPKG